MVTIAGMNRDAYGFPVRPQHVQRYREYADIYKVLFAYGHAIILKSLYCSLFTSYTN